MALFGTDGVRGVANADLTSDLALRIARSAVQILSPERPARVITAHDSRISGEMLDAAVSAGLASAGADVERVGVLPTPGLAYLVQRCEADLGVMISASHNPAADNGVKIFGPGGRKLTEEQERRIEEQLGVDAPLPTGENVGRITSFVDAEKLYLEHLLTAVSPLPRALRVVVDCANGAAFRIAPEAYRRVGAEVIAIGDEPNGANINNGVGSTHLDAVQTAVRAHSADIGIAHDGDADRCLAVDAEGSVIDGDAIMAILAARAARSGDLVNNTLVTTVMSNLGLHRAMRERGISVLTTPVGDRHVTEAMDADSLTLGGEQSGHIIMSEYATTGDGILTGLLLLHAVAESEKTARECAEILTVYPQVLLNVAVEDREVVDAPDLLQAVKDAEATLGEDGRVLIRASGTEPLIRVMVEASSEQKARDIAEQLADIVRNL